MGKTWRLQGIDAPEAKQTCGDWPAGLLAASALQSLVSGRNVACQEEGKDRYGRTIGRCFVGGADIGAEMVRRGWAWAFVRYSTEYVKLEELARGEGVGIWAHKCQVPWEWRAEARANARRE